VRGVPRDHEVCIEVEDTGPGIPYEQQPHLFRPFARLAAAPGVPGLGLGLATVRRLAEGFGGSTGVRSTPGAGSTFWVVIPLAPRADEHEQAAAAPQLR
jgi:signal transduction histidine kinase